MEEVVEHPHQSQGTWSEDDPFFAIRQTANSKLDNQQKAMNLLDAVERTLDERSLARTPANYFGAFWPLLDKADGKLTGTVVYLCSFVVPLLEASFIQEHYSQIYARLPGLLSSEVSGDAPLVRASLGCVKQVLGAFRDEEAWSERETLKEILSAVLGFCLDERPKVRRAAHDAISGIISSGDKDGSVSYSPALGLIVQFCKLVFQGSTRKESSRALHLAPLLKRLIPSLDQSSIDGLLGPVFQCCGLGNGHLSCALFGFLAELSRTKSDDDNDDGADDAEILKRRVQLNASQGKKILDGLVRLMPPGNWELADISSAWIGAFGQILSHPSLKTIARDDHLKTLIGALDSSHESVHLAVQLAFSHQQEQQPSDGLSALLLEALQKVSLERISVLPYLLAIIRDQVMLRSRSTMATTMTEIDGQILFLAASFYERKGFTQCRGDVTKAIGDFCRVFGAGPVLSTLPLGMETAGGTSRAWLLPIFKESISNDSLALFTSHFLPLADRIQAKADSFRQQEKLGDAKVYETIVFQLWSLVPSFLKYPVDLAQAMPSFAPRLAGKITDDPILRPALVHALTGLIQRCRQFEDDIGSGSIQLSRPISLESNEQAIRMLESLVPHLLPVIFNLLGVTVSDQRAYILDCIRSLLDLSPAHLVSDYFGKVSAGAMASQGQQRVAMLELLCTMVPFLDGSAYKGVFDLVLPILGEAGTDESGLQKAAYKSLHFVLSHELYGPSILQSNLEAIEQALISSAELTEVGAVRKCRFRLLLGLIPQLPDSSLHWIPVFLPETVLGTKEVNQKARLLSFELLLAMARRMARGGVIQAEKSGLPQDMPGSLEEFMTMVLAGLAGKTPHMISATVISLARLLFDLGSSLPIRTVHALLGDILLLFGSPSREIVKAAFGFVKVAVVSLPPEVIGQEHLSVLIESILAWSGEHAMHFKVRVRHLLERLVRRFGFDAVAACVPEQHQRLIQNIRKRKERLRRRKAAEKENMGGDEEGADEDGEMMNLDAITQAALSRQTSMVTRRGITSSAQATRPSAKFEAALYDSDSELEDDQDGMEEDMMDTNTPNPTGNDEDDLETALSRKLTIARTSKSFARTTQTKIPSLAQKNKMMKSTQVTKKPSNRAYEEDFKKNPEGKMIIEDSDDDDGDGDDGVLVDESAHRLYEQSLKSGFQRPGKHAKFSQKRKLHDSDDEGGDDDGYGVKSSTSRLSRLSKVSRHQQSAPHQHQHSGREFQAKGGAKGDLKSKRNKHEPYAYVPLQRATKGAKKSSGRYFMSSNKK